MSFFFTSIFLSLIKEVFGQKQASCTAQFVDLHIHSIHTQQTSTISYYPPTVHLDPMLYAHAEDLDKMKKAMQINSLLSI